MKIAEYFEAIKDRFFVTPFVSSFRILKQVDRSKNGHLRAHAAFSDSSQLEFSEFVEQNAEEEIELVTYSHHWSDKDDNLIRRWDNTPHFPKLRNFPHHVHIGEDDVIPGEPINVFGVLDVIGKILRKS
jgi:hypothetical protein